MNERMGRRVYYCFWLANWMVLLQSFQIFICTSTTKASFPFNHRSDVSVAFIEPRIVLFRLFPSRSFRGCAPRRF